MRRSHLARIAAAAVVAGVVATAGCTSDDSVPASTASATTATATAPAPNESPTASPTPSVSEPSVSDTPVSAADPTSEAQPAKAAPFVADREMDLAQASEGVSLSPVNMRFGVHDGYDRIVLDLVGTGQPGWLSEYIEDPQFAGTGHTYALAGDAFLVAYVRGVVNPTEPGASEYGGPLRFRPASGGVVKEVVYGTIYDGQLDIYVGLSSEQPFRVFLLEDPTRVVIDVQHP